MYIKINISLLIYLNYNKIKGIKMQMNKYQEPELTYGEFLNCKEKKRLKEEDELCDNYDTDGSNKCINLKEVVQKKSIDEDYEDYTYNQ